MTRTLEQREEPGPPKRSMSKARRLRLYLACGGRCVCGVKVPMSADIDHDNPLWISHDDSDGNLRFLCDPCHAAKTYGQDIPRIAKTKRQRRKHLGQRRKTKAIQSRGFPKGGPKQKIPSRPFQKSRQEHG